MLSKLSPLFSQLNTFTETTQSEALKNGSKDMPYMAVRNLEYKNTKMSAAMYFKHNAHSRFFL